MSAAKDALFGILQDEAEDYAKGYLEEKDLRVTVKTNYGPAYSFSAIDNSETEQASGVTDRLLELIGFRASVLVTDRSGAVVASYGDPAPTEPKRQAAAAGAVLLIGFIFMRGLTK